MAQYVALLRGINVGGNNVIRMAELRATFEGLGFERVGTYVQSGNVIFDAADATCDALAARIEAGLTERFGYEARIVLRSYAQLRNVVAAAPAGFGTQPDLYRYDVVFLRDPLTAPDALRDIPTRNGVDQAFAGDRVCYFSRLISRASQSYLSRVVGLPGYRSMTIRNWNTTVKLLALLDGRAARAQLDDPRSAP
jgi:uncharacterized protein (DUF1697 family)